MKVTCITTFLDGRDRFEAGDVRQVDDERGARFVAAGWATADEPQPVPAVAGDVALNVQSVTHKTEVIYG